MLIDWLYQVKESIDRHGIRFGLLFALYAIYRKERRNYRLDKRDEAIFENQRIVMEKLGVGDQWSGQVRMSNNEEVQNLKRLYQSLQVGINQAHQQRRAIKMNQNINLATLAPGIIAVLKLVFQSFGMEIPDEHINSMVNGAAALMAVIAVIMSHRKPNGGTVNEPTQPTGDTGSAV